MPASVMVLVRIIFYITKGSINIIITCSARIKFSVATGFAMDMIASILAKFVNKRG